MNKLEDFPHLNRYVSNLKNIPSGKFRWGYTSTDESIAPSIAMSPLRVGATPVTWKIWKEYCIAESLRMPQQPRWGYLEDHPVVNVSWDDIMKPGGFCGWASRMVGFKLTLPTDAQWEYAARGEKDGLEYPWGDELESNRLWGSVGSFSDPNMTAVVDRIYRIHRNGYGLTDMIGNVWEWCLDYHNDDFRPVGRDPEDTKRSRNRCVRGGSWNGGFPVGFRCADRNKLDPESKYDDYGFRLAAGPR